MEFCSKCGMLYHTEEKDEKLMYVCHNCGNEEENHSHIIESTKVSDSTLDNINPDIVYDITYPRTNKKKCPNEKCDKQEAIIMRDKSLKVIYMCVHCKTIFSA
jgi:DNA-directed RNA polymerase subunit M/transcription elongation factor TFIIS